MISPIKREPIAIIGMACRFPGAANPQAFWKLLCEGIDAVTPASPEHLSVDTYDDPQAVAGKIASRWGGWLKGIDGFDSHFFGIAPREAAYLDPQLRLLLEVSWEAVEDAGELPQQLAGSRTGVFIGETDDDYSKIRVNDDQQLIFYAYAGSSRAMISGRLSYALDLRGPSLTIDTACSSSLVAVHQACQSIWSGESTMAFAGGVHLILSQDGTMGFSQGGALSAGGRCKAFSADADGFVRSEGIAVVLLKPLTQALADRNPIHALIRGSAVSNDGQSNHQMFAPSQIGQESALREAYRVADVSPGDIRYVETHGTGTPVGDPVELAALGAVLSEGRAPEQACWIGSCKTNIGHTEAAAGVAGLIKVALCLKHRMLPPNLHFNTPNPTISWETLPLQVVQHLQTWEGDEAALASVSSFGMSGTNAHVVLQEALPLSDLQSLPITPSTEQQPYVLALSAKTEAALAELAQSWRTFLGAPHEPLPTLADLCFTASARRTHHAHRLAIIGKTRDELAEHLAAFANQELSPAWVSGQIQPDMQHRLVFVFSGQGSQWFGMGKTLLKTSATFRAALQECEQAMRPYIDWSLLDLLAADEEPPRFQEIAVIQPTIFAVQVALARLWISWGIVPQAVIGHSMGEVAAACIAGILSLEDAARIICLRSQLLMRVRGQGAMAFVELSLAQAREILRGREGLITPGVNNSPTSTVLSGDATALQEVLAELSAQGVFWRLVKVDVASHSPQMDPLLVDLRAYLQGIVPHSAVIPFYSTVVQSTEPAPVCDADYWVRNLREPVLFASTVACLLSTQHDIFVEMSPHPLLLSPIGQCAQAQQQHAMTLPSLRRGEDEQTTLLRTLGSLYTLGISIDWQALFKGRERCVSLPTYPWQHEHYWLHGQEQDDGLIAAGRQGRKRRDGKPAHPFLQHYMRLTPQMHAWESYLHLRTFPYLQDHQVQEQIVLPATVYLEAASAAGQEVWGHEAFSLENVRFEKAIFLHERAPQRLQILLDTDLAERATVRFSTFAAQENDEHVLHAQVTLRAHSGQLQDERACAYDLDAIQQRCQERITREQHYLKTQRHGLFYGPSFQGVEHIWKGEGEALAVVQPTAACPEEQSPYHVHPALLDACLQIGIQVVPSDSGVYLPVAIERVTFVQSLQEVHWVYARMHPSDEAEAAVLHFDTVLLNAQGEVLALIDGVQLQRLANRTQADDIGDWFYALQWEALSSDEVSTPVLPDGSGAWLVFADAGHMAPRVMDILHKQGGSCTLVYPGERYRQRAANSYELPVHHPEAFKQALTDLLHEQRVWRGVVYCWSLDTPLSEVLTEVTLSTALERSCISLLHIVQVLVKQEMDSWPTLSLITRGAQAVGEADQPLSSAQAALWGLGRVISQEHPELHSRLIDLSPDDTLLDPRLLVQEILSTNRQEDQLALRGQQCYVPRLVPERPAATTQEPAAPQRLIVQPDSPFELVVTQPGLLESIHLRACEPAPPGPGEVEIQVIAAGLNFKDVLIAIGVDVGQTPGSTPLGWEHAGIISRVGEGVTEWRVGDEVVAVVQRGIASFVTLPAAHVLVRKPAGLSFIEAVTLSVPFITAHHALNQLGKLAAGERVLIHSACGGLGMAALQLARLAGAEIFATAGTEEKRAWLRTQGISHVMDSHTLAFAEEIMTITNGRGVDIVLNSLSGEALKKSLAVLGAGGRFLEIGKRDIYQDSQIGLRALANNISFSTVALDTILAEHPQQIRALFQEVMQFYQDGLVRPLPQTVFSINECEQAFRYMAQGRHTGKIVLSFDTQQVEVEPLPSNSTLFKSDATYLLTGGLGGIGLELAHWMVEHGARHLVLAGRRAPSQAVQTRLEELHQQHGASLLPVQADIARGSDVAAVLQQIEHDLPPLRGVIHAAAVLDDGTLLHLDRSRFQTVIAPKILGAWHLHQCTKHLPLDFFVYFSSVAGLLGSPGQSNYCAANTFLDTFAHERQALGLPALSINWGAWSQVGLAAAQANRGERIALRGIRSFTPQQGLQAFEWLLAEQQAQMAFMPFDIAQWQQFYPIAERTALLARLAMQAAQGHQNAPQTDLLVRFQQAQAEERLPMMEAYLGERLAKILGYSQTTINALLPLHQLGLDSLMALEWRNVVKRDLGVQIPMADLFQHANIRQVAERALEEILCTA